MNDSFDELTELLLLSFSSPILFLSNQCSACSTSLTLPTVHFLCKHSYHSRCLPNPPLPGSSSSYFSKPPSTSFDMDVVHSPFVSSHKSNSFVGIPSQERRGEIPGEITCPSCSTQQSEILELIQHQELDMGTSGKDFQRELNQKTGYLEFPDQGSSHLTTSISDDDLMTFSLSKLVIPHGGDILGNGDEGFSFIASWFGKNQFFQLKNLS